MFEETRDRGVDWHYSINVSVIEIYNEMIRDLLGDDPSAKLEIKQGRDGLFVPGLSEIQVNDVEELNEVKIMLTLEYIRIAPGSFCAGSITIWDKPFVRMRNQAEMFAALPRSGFEKGDVKAPLLRPEMLLRYVWLMDLVLTDVDWLFDWQVFAIGKTNRATAITDMNEHSSRSHALLCVTVVGVNKTTGHRTTGKTSRLYSGIVPEHWSDSSSL